MSTPQSPSDEQDRPFTCPHTSCGRRFHRKFTLHEHLKTHTGEKPYMCPVHGCGKRFSTSGNLSRHRRLHLAERFECPVGDCTRIFTKKDKLLNHLKAHEGRVTHTCRIAGCRKTFSTAGNLTRHMRTQHRQRCGSSDVPSPQSTPTSSPLTSESFVSLMSAVETEQKDGFAHAELQPTNLPGLASRIHPFGPGSVQPMQMTGPAMELKTEPTPPAYGNYPPPHPPGFQFSDQDINDILDCMIVQPPRMNPHQQHPMNQYNITYGRKNGPLDQPPHPW